MRLLVALRKKNLISLFLRYLLAEVFNRSCSWPKSRLSTELFYATHTVGISSGQPFEQILVIKSPFVESKQPQNRFSSGGYYHGMLSLCSSRTQWIDVISFK